MWNGEYIVPLFLYLDTRRARVVIYNYYKLDQLYAHNYNVLIYKIPTCFVGRSRDRFPVVSMGIFSVATDGTMCPGVDSTSKNEYQGFLLG